MHNHIILEGPDGTGKSSLIAEMKQLLENKGFTVVTSKNPSSLKLYQQMHEGILTPFQIAMSTLADMYTDFKLRLQNAREMENVVVLQDRSALISAQVYNLPKMSYYEYNIWICAALDIFDNYYRDGTQFVILTNVPHRNEDNIFISNDNIAHYQLLAINGGLFWQTFLSFSSGGNITESAQRLLEELGYDT